MALEFSDDEFAACVDRAIDWLDLRAVPMSLALLKSHESAVRGEMPSSVVAQANGNERALAVQWARLAGVNIRLEDGALVEPVREEL